MTLGPLAGEDFSEILEPSEIAKIDVLISQTLGLSTDLHLNSAVEAARAIEAERQLKGLMITPIQHLHEDDYFAFEEIVNRTREHLKEIDALEHQIDAIFKASAAILRLTERRSNGFCLSSHV